MRLFNGPLVSPTYCLLQLLQEIRYTTFSEIDYILYTGIGADVVASVDVESRNAMPPCEWGVL